MATKQPLVNSAGQSGAQSPWDNQQGLVGTERSTDITRRLETDSSGNLYVNVATSPTVTVTEDAPALPYRNINLGNTGQVVKASAAYLHGYYISNSGAAKAYVKVYDKATAATSSDTPIATFEIPAGSAANVASNSPFVTTTAGLSVRATTGVADNDASSPAANEVIVNLFYR